MKPNLEVSSVRMTTVRKALVEKVEDLKKWNDSLQQLGRFRDDQLPCPFGGNLREV